MYICYFVCHITIKVLSVYVRKIDRLDLRPHSCNFRFENSMNAVNFIELDMRPEFKILSELTVNLSRFLRHATYNRTDQITFVSVLRCR